MLKSHCDNNNEKKKKRKKKNIYMQLLGRKPTSLELIGHCQNHYATDTDSKYQQNIYIYNKS